MFHYSIAAYSYKIKTALEGFIKSPNADSSEYKKRLLATFVDSVAVLNEKIVIYFKFPVPGAGDKAERSFDDFVRKTTSVSTCLVCANISKGFISPTAYRGLGAGTRLISPFSSVKVPTKSPMSRARVEGLQET